MIKCKIYLSIINNFNYILKKCRQFQKHLIYCELLHYCIFVYACYLEGSYNCKNLIVSNVSYIIWFIIYV